MIQNQVSHLSYLDTEIITVKVRLSLLRAGWGCWGLCRLSGLTWIIWPLTDKKKTKTKDKNTAAASSCHRVPTTPIYRGWIERRCSSPQAAGRYKPTCYAALTGPTVNSVSAQKRDENMLEFDRQQRLINSIQNSQTWNEPVCDSPNEPGHKTGS